MKNFGEKTKRWFKSLFVQTDGNEPKMLTFVKKEGTQTVISSILCALLGILLGYIVLLCINAENAGKAMGAILKNFGNFSSNPRLEKYYFGSTLVKSVPLIMCGLSVMFAYKAGLFNIGVGGQYCIGICFSLYAALVWQLPWYACIIVAALIGAALGCAFRIVQGAVQRERSHRLHYDKLDRAVSHKYFAESSESNEPYVVGNLQNRKKSNYSRRWSFKTFQQ